jgi:hypothetical protein
MTLENQNTPVAITDADVDRETNRLIAAACAKHNITVSELPPGTVESARQNARDMLETEAALKSNPLYGQLQAEREAHKLTRMELGAVKQTRIAPNNDVKPVADVARVRGLMGERDWHALTDGGRLAACGIPPATVTPIEIQEAKNLFGRGVDSHYASNFFKQDAGRYRHLKNIAIVLGLQGK